MKPFAQTASQASFWSTACVLCHRRMCKKYFAIQVAKRASALELTDAALAMTATSFSVADAFRAAHWGWWGSQRRKSVRRARRHANSAQEQNRRRAQHVQMACSFLLLRNRQRALARWITKMMAHARLNVRKECTRILQQRAAMNAAVHAPAALANQTSTVCRAQTVRHCILEHALPCHARKEACCLLSTKPAMFAR